MRVRTRAVVVNAVLLLIALAMAVVAMGIGDIPLSPAKVLDGLVGQPDEFTRMVVREWRLPPIAGALVFGGLLGVGGAIFQSLTRNPLGSPDVIGFDAGSYTAVVIVMLVFGTSDYYTVATASIIGGLATAALVYLLSWRRGVQGFRLIIVGIAVSAVLGSVNSYLITRADIDDAMAVGFWGAGSLSRVTLDNLAPVLVISVLVAVAAALLARPLRQLELGDDAAMSQGIAASPVRLGLIIIVGVGGLYLIWLLIRETRRAA